MEDKEGDKVSTRGRELRFRAWDKSTNFWMLLEKVPCFSATGEIPVLPGIIVEQYIGFKDEDSKEIYEGDLVEIKDLGIKEIKWGDSGITGFNLAEAWAKQTKVLGNIHQNPELLNGKPKDGKHS